MASRTRGFLSVAAAVLLVSAAVGCGSPRLQLSLEVHSTELTEGQNLWYRLTLKNAGWRSVVVSDPFWRFHQRTLTNQREREGTFLVVMAANHAAVPHYFHYRGLLVGYSEAEYWEDDCGGGVHCKRTGFTTVTLRPGEALVATPSLLTDFYCAADCPTWGDVQSRRGAAVPGFRILDTVQEFRPGRYVVQAFSAGPWTASSNAVEFEVKKDTAAVSLQPMLPDRPMSERRKRLMRAAEKVIGAFSGPKR